MRLRKKIRNWCEAVRQNTIRVLQLHILGVVAMLSMGLTVFSYLDRIYRELGRVATKRILATSDVFENEIEPRIGLKRRSAALVRLVYWR